MMRCVAVAVFVGLAGLVPAAALANNTAAAADANAEAALIKSAQLSAAVFAQAAGLQPVQINGARGELFSAPVQTSAGGGATGEVQLRARLQQYDAYLFTAPVLHFAPLSAKPGRGEAKQLRAALSRTLRARLEAATGWRAAQNPGPRVVQVRAALTQLQFAAPSASKHTRTTAIVAPGAMVQFVLEARDAATDEVLLHYRSRRPLPGGTFTGPAWHELDRLRLLMRSFAADTALNLGALLGR